jgi:hypothetical protein
MSASISRACSVGAFVAVLTLGATATAEIPNFIMEWDASGDTQDPLRYDPSEFGEVIEHGDGTFTYLGGLASTLWSIEWDVFVDPDPIVDAQIIVTNTADVFQTFSLLMTLPIAPSLTTSTIDGGVSATVTNEFNLVEGATLRAATGSSIYSAFIDDPFGAGTPVMTLMDSPFALITDPIPFDERSATEAFGPMAGGPVDSSIEVLLEFELSPGDSASVNGFFQAVPGPGGLAVLALLGIGGRRRR